MLNNIRFIECLVAMFGLWMTDFDDMPTHLGLFYAYRFSDHVHCTFIFTFFIWLFHKVFFIYLFARNP